MAIRPADLLPRTYSRQVLDQTPGRVLTFLAAIARTPAIRLALEGGGYTDEEHALGWTLLHDATGFVPSTRQPIIDPEIRQALAEVDAWDNATMPRIEAALRRLHPSAAAMIFAGLSPGQGTESLLVVKTFLDRLDQLEAQDPAAIATVTARKVTPKERTRMRGLLAKIEKGAAAEEPPATPDPIPALTALKSWFDDWAATARVQIRRRDHLIRLGLARRRVKKTNDAENTDTGIVDDDDIEFIDDDEVGEDVA